MNDQINILLIDDEQNIINSLKRILNKNEYIIYSANNSENAIEIINNYKLDIIICDYNMPNLTGIEILKHAKKILPNAIRMLITGYADLNVTISAINEVGIYYYITKPWKNDEVIDIVEKAIEEKINSIDLLQINKNLRSHKTRSLSSFPVTDDEDIILVKNKDICFLYALDGNVSIVTDGKKFKSTDSLNAWENKLGDNFIRCHRSYIVNMDKIEKISPWFNGAYNIKLQKLNETVPVSRGYMKKIREILEF